MNLQFFTANIKAKCAEAAATLELKKSYERKVRSWHLRPEEEKLLWVFSPFAADGVEDALTDYEILINIMRGNSGNPADWSDLDVVEKLGVDEEVLADENFYTSAVRNAVRWYSSEVYPQGAVAFIKKFISAVDGAFMFLSLEHGQKFIYERILAALLEKHLGKLPIGMQKVILTSFWLARIVEYGLDADEMLRQGVHEYRSLDNRRDQSVDYASALLLNAAPLDTETNRTIGEWIKDYLNSVGGRCNEKNIQEYLDSVAAKTTEDGAGLLGIILTLYYRLVSGYYDLEDIDLVSEEAGRRAVCRIVKEKVEGIYGKLGAVKSANIGKVMDRLAYYAERYGLSAINELCIFDESSGKFKWNSELLGEDE